MIDSLTLLVIGRLLSIPFTDIYKFGSNIYIHYCDDSLPNIVWQVFLMKNRIICN